MRVSVYFGYFRSDPVGLVVAFDFQPQEGTHGGLAGENERKWFKNQARGRSGGQNHRQRSRPAIGLILLGQKLSPLAQAAFFVSQPARLALIGCPLNYIVQGIIVW